MIKINELSFCYDHHFVFDNTHFEADIGRLTVIKGESGSGKTTLLDIIALKHGNVFNVTYDDVPIQTKPYLSHLYYMTQDPILCDSLKIKDQWNLLMKNYGHNPHLNQYISLLGLENIQNLYPSQLSGGEKLRVALIQIFIIKPQIVLLDEPTASLDDDYKNKCVELLHILKQNCHLIVSTHDPHIFHEADVLYDIRNKKLYLEKICQNQNHVTLPDHLPKLKIFWLLDFFKMKKHHFIREIMTLLLISVPIAFFAYAYCIETNFVSSFENHLKSLNNTHILLYKPLDKRFKSFTYYTNTDQATAFPIHEDEYRVISSIEEIKEIKPKMIFPTYFNNIFGSTSIPNLKIYKDHEMIYEYKDTANKLILENSYDYSQLFIESIRDDEIEEHALKIFNNKKNGIYINEKFLKKCALSENDIENASMKITIGVPVYDISGEYEFASISDDDSSTVLDDDMIPANEIWYAPKELTLPIQGIIKSNTTDLYTKDFYMTVEDLETIAYSHKVNKGKTVYLKNSDTDFIEVQNANEADLTIIYTPWRPNGYTIEIDQVKNVSFVVEKLEKMGYGVDWKYNDYKVYGESIQITQNMIQTISIIAMIFITLIFTLLHFIKEKKEEKFNTWLKSIGYHQQKTLLFIKFQKYFLNTLFIITFTYLILWLVNIYSLHTSSHLYAIDSSIILIIIFIALLTQFCIPLLWEVLQNAKTR